MFHHILIALFVGVTAGRGFAAEFHIDPVNGSPEGDGSAARPWRSLQAVVDRGLIQTRKPASLPYKDGVELVADHVDAPIAPGNTIVLHEGDHGALKIINHYNAEPITIAATEGATPRFTHILVQSSANWVLRGLHVQPDPNDIPRTLVNLSSHNWRGPVHDIILAHCTIESAADATGWTRADWNDKTANGAGVGGTRMTLRHNTLRNVNHGISCGATHSLVEHNTIENFAGDGLRGLGDHTTFQHNTVRNCYDVNDNHDDGFQSWTRTAEGVGKGKVVGVVLRHNTIINYTDPNQPFRGTLQGIGCFDGFFEDWVIEDNVVVVDHWHGITLLGATNGTIRGNTVRDLNADRPGPPWIMIGKHKDGRPSSGCVIRDNSTPDIRVDKGQQITTEDNVIVTETGLP